MVTKASSETKPNAKARRDGTKARTFGNYALGDILGKGTFGEVKVATRLDTGERLAVKILSTSKTPLQELEGEILHQRLSHQHVVRIHEIIKQSELTFIVMELASGGDLLEHLKGGRVPEQEARRIFQQIVAGVEHSHKQGIAHRDLKCENIFMDGACNVKIGDFGFSKEMRQGELLRERVGTPFYAAPELLSGRSCAYKGPEVDVWACGVILYRLLVGAFPFQHTSEAELFDLIRKGQYSMPAFVSNDAKDLIAGILTVDRAQRISLLGIQEHRWFQGRSARTWSTWLSNKFCSRRWRETTKRGPSEEDVTEPAPKRRRL